ncbi:MAG: aspartyl-tRNA(Asn)/glutamyl-tRNA(Gln) amidotransferase subunit B [Myxococcota bacterium]
MSEFETVIGLEVHVQLATQTKLFCGCSIAFGNEPNANVCEICLGMPGVLPVMNAEALRLAVRLGTALGCEISDRSVFSRKNYFYPDLPKGYQVTQFDRPICEGGSITITLAAGDGATGDVTRSIPLTRIHLEEDAGKNTHLANAPQSHIDFNRAGTPLCEVVSDPELRSSDEAVAYLRELRNIVRYLGACDGHMEQGSFRCDANVSIRPVGQTALGTRTELKNLNSFGFVKRAIEYELNRQAEVIRSGGTIVQETRLWDEKANVTRSMRSKEEAHDYRYFPEPDLLPLVVDAALRAAALKDMPELPRARRDRYVAELGVTEYDADVLTSEHDLSDYFDAVVSAGADGKTAANWVQGDLRGRLNADGLTFTESPVPAADLAEILTRVGRGKLSGKLAKQVFAKVYGGETLKAVLAQTGDQLTDPAAIRAAIEPILDAKPVEVAQFLEGKQQVIGFFIGQVMKATRGKANPQVVRTVLIQALTERGE